MHLLAGLVIAVPLAAVSGKAADKMPLTGLAPAKVVPDLCLYHYRVSTESADCQTFCDQAFGYYYSYVWEYDPTVGAQTWTQVATPTKVDTDTPSYGYETFIYDPSRSKIILYGGQTNALGNPVVSETWKWDGSKWTQLSPATSPSIAAAANLFNFPSRLTRSWTRTWCATGGSGMRSGAVSTRPTRARWYWSTATSGPTGASRPTSSAPCWSGAASAGCWSSA